ncbi:uncharacterized protein LOC133823379 [Humulus lupulus]|uniref:uncharacterized protein LOC133823379 n=1 Tax=Humulus lupulus TaxID=3486 RepID=UPI002B4154C7|nr:uncharacterized protein LOC133823379 [Humulus lupulus]
MGDFNSYLYNSDKYGGSQPNFAAMNMLADFLDKYNMFPLPFIDKKFTWTNNNVYERLDCWLTESSFFDTVQNSWLPSTFDHDDHSNPLSSFSEKQFNCTNSLKSWNEDNFKSIESRISSLQDKISNLQSVVPPNVETPNKIKTLQSQLDVLLLKEEIYWKQRASVFWLNFGDKNTRFFHKYATNRRRTNHIRYLTLDDGAKVDTFKDIINNILSYFSNLFSTQGVDPDALNVILFGLNQHISINHYQMLDQPFTPEGVKTALFQLSGDKAPGFRQL